MSRFDFDPVSPRLRGPALAAYRLARARNEAFRQLFGAAVANNLTVLDGMDPAEQARRALGLLTALRRRNVADRRLIAAVHGGLVGLFAGLDEADRVAVLGGDDELIAHLSQPLVDQGDDAGDQGGPAVVRPQGDRGVEDEASAVAHGDREAKAGVEPAGMTGAGVPAEDLDHGVADDVEVAAHEVRPSDGVTPGACAESVPPVLVIDADKGPD